MNGGFLARLRTAGLALALAAITFRALLPPGFMLSADDQRISVVLCGIEAGRTLSFDPITGAFSEPDAPAPDHPRAGEECPFAVAAAPALVVGDIGVDAPREIVTLMPPPLPLAERPQTTPTGPPLPARGPPLNA